ncbi:MAG: antibiotic biosynthesis monooxygenase [Rhodospirillales bacterium]|nr:antibiotic biosynthesis monooxygenase [Rhodospirillales bacterium]
MIVVIFEVTPRAGKADEYFEIAGTLREDLSKIDGFISIERFESVQEKGKFLSYSVWRDREAVESWYALASHKKAQVQGRTRLFEDYRIRVAEVFRDYTMATGRPIS